MFKIKLLLLFLICSVFSFAQDQPDNSGTFSILAYDSLTGELGVAVKSKMVSVGAIIPYAKAGVGAIAVQGFPNTAFGPQGLEMLSNAVSVQRVVENLIQNDQYPEKRQIGILDAQGNSYSYTGLSCRKYAGHVIGKYYCVQGNGLLGEAVLKVVARTFEITPGDLADRFVSTLEAGEKAEGDNQGWQSAALLIVKDKGGYGGNNDRFIDIRVDSDTLPLVSLRRIYEKWKDNYLLAARLLAIDEFNRSKKYSSAQAETARLVEALNSELRNKPDDPEVLNRIAWILATHDIDRERALELAKRATKLAPTQLSMLNTMAECHFHLGHLDEAIAIESELVIKEPGNDDYWKQLQKFKEAKLKGIR